MIDPDRLRELTRDLGVLVAEGDPTERGRLTAELGALFGEVIEAADGPAALRAYHENLPDLVIADIALGGMDGLALTREILAGQPKQLILILTPHHDPELLALVAKNGVAGFVFKPVDAGQLAAALHQAAGRLQERRRLLHYQDHLAETAQALVTDPLTGLYNQRKLEEWLLTDGVRPLLLLELDNLATIDWTLGPHLGAHALRALADALRAARPAGGEIYRLARGQFALTLADGDATDAAEFAQGLSRRLEAAPLSLQGNLRIRPRLTMAVAEGEGFGLLHQARNALMEARSRGERVRLERGRGHAAARQDQTVAWIERVRAALERGRVVPFFQPIVDNRDGRIVKFECLARIVDGAEVIDPERFIGPARLGGLIPELTLAILEQGMAALRRLPCEISVNITEEELHEADFAERMRADVERHGIAPGRMVFEVLEGIGIEGDGRIPEQLERLKALGFKLAIDDFGAERSNFGRLLDLDADYLKIDGRFIRELDCNPKSRAICRAVTRLAQEMGTRVVAEHVHNQAIQAEVLRLGIDYSQGYLFGEPGPDPGRFLADGAIPAHPRPDRQG